MFELENFLEKYRRFVFGISLFALVFGCFGSNLNAQSYYDFSGGIAQQRQLAQEAQSLWWNSLSERQKYLVHVIGEFQEEVRLRMGIPSIPINQENFNVVMQVIGAYPHESEFVLERMRWHAQFDHTMQQADAAIGIAQCLASGGGARCYQ